MERIVYRVEESKAGKHYEAYCPELVITAFGNTSEEARQELRTQIDSYLKDCEELGILEDVLIEAGFYDDGESWVSDLVTPVREPRVVIL